MTGLQKAAILLVLLGEEASSAIYNTLSAGDLQRLTQEIADLGYVSADVAEAVLQEYHKLTQTQDYLAQGGPEYANKLLVKALGEEEAQIILAQVMLAQEESAANFEYLQKADPEQLAKFVEGEHPQTIAVVLAHLGIKAASALLVMLSESVRARSIGRLAEMRQFSPEFVNKISLVLHKKLGKLGKQSRRSYGGVKVVADLLNRMDQNTSKTVLESIEQDNPQLALSVRNLMFTFEDFLTVRDDGIRELLSQCDKKVIALALRGTSEDVKNHFFQSMSSRAVEMLKEDMEVLGPVRSRDVAKAQEEIVALARKLEAQGKIFLKAEQSDEYVV
jgi:flagellar motor switch protein FliG